MNAKTKVLIYQFVSFAVIFLLARYLIASFLELGWIWIPILSAVIATVLTPQFKVIHTEQGEKILMRWIFLKGVKTIK